MDEIPSDIRAVRDEQVLAVSWGQQQAKYEFAALRGQCECAQCVNEWTGERILDPASIRADISIEKLELVGSYAVRIHWSDGHSSGLFTWQRLRELRTSEEAE